jgi:hypothetical protein
MGFSVAKEINKEEQSRKKEAVVDWVVSLLCCKRGLATKHEADWPSVRQIKLAQPCE